MGVEVAEFQVPPMYWVGVAMALLAIVLAIVLAIGQFKRAAAGPFEHVRAMVVVSFLLGMFLSVGSLVVAAQDASTATMDIVNDHYGVELSVLPEPHGVVAFEHDGQLLTAAYSDDSRVVVMAGNREYGTTE